ncbi:MAG: hypothetical protein RLZZ301_678 [Bacteroidota bacterium]|jgi:5-formyltetrahydrofolate cyclo-ligase
MQKAAIRQHYKAKRGQLSPYELSRISSQVCGLVMDSFSFHAKNISLFLPIEKQHEINTYGLLEELMLQGAHTVLSKANFQDHSLELFFYQEPAQLELSAYGIPEPKYGKTCAANKLDFVFVPLLAIDNKGHRVGYGKGFYDRLLRHCKAECQFIGLHLFDEFVEIDDLHPNDIALHQCFTPNGIYDFR